MPRGGGRRHGGRRYHYGRRGYGYYYPYTYGVYSYPYNLYSSYPAYETPSYTYNPTYVTKTEDEGIMSRWYMQIILGVALFLGFLMLIAIIVLMRK